MMVAWTARLEARVIIAHSGFEPMGTMHGALEKIYGLFESISVRASMLEKNTYEDA